MTISIRTAFSNVASENYDKTNLFFYIILSVLTGICGMFFSDKGSGLTFPVLVIYLFFIFIMNGIYIMALNNAIHEKNSVIPNLFSDFKEITVNGFLNTSGCFLISSILTFVLAVPFFILLKINPFLGLIIIPFVFILGVYFMGFYFNYAISLKFADWFNIKKASVFIKKSAGKLGKYILKFLILNVICLIIAFLIVAPIAFVLGFQTIFSPVVVQNLKLSAVSIASTLIFSVIFAVGYIYVLDLTAQFIKEVNFKQQENVVIE